MFDLIEHQRKIACVREEAIFGKIGGLRLSQRRVAAERPFAEGLHRAELSPYPGDFRIKVWVFSLSQD